MPILLPLIIFTSLVSFTVSLNTTTYLQTGRSTQDDIHVTTGFSTALISSSGAYSATDKILNENHRSDILDSKDYNVSATSKNALTENKFDEDVNQMSMPGNFSDVDGMKWDKVDALLQLHTKAILGNFHFMDAIRRANASEVCKSSLERYLNSLSDLETWAVKMADANGKMAAGVLEGRFVSFGSYEECLKIRVPDSAGDVEEFRGQYCLSHFRSPLLSTVYLKNGTLNRQYVDTYGVPPPWIQEFILRMGPYLKHLVFSLGTCVPSTCTELDLTQIITHIVSPFELSVEVADCQVEEPITWTKSLIAAVSALSIIALLCIISTIIDIANRVSTNRVPEAEISDHCKHFKMDLLKIFSVPSNIEILINKDNESSFGCLDGIRFLTATWIVLYHTYLIISSWYFHKFSNALAYKEDFSGSLLLAAIDNVSIPIASFFMMSGFLMSYWMWRKLEKGNGKANFFKFVLHKYWRFTPCIALTLAVFVVIVHTGSGPLWNSTMDRPMEMCHTNGWKTFLYIANWWKWDDMCLIHTWFVACLMQLHLIGFIIIQITFRWPRVGVFLGVMIVLACVTLVVTIAVLKNISLPTTMAQKDFDVLLVWRSWFRYKPFYYMQSYAIGLLVGYLVMNYKGKQMKKRYQALGWFLSSMLILYAVYGTYGPEDSIEFTAVYYGLSLIAWSSSLGWIIYACIAGYGGILNSFLSWQGFRVLGSISYLIYLLHVVLIYYNNAFYKEVVHYGHYEMISSFFSTLIISIFLAFVGHVTVEMPFNHLEKLIF